MLKTLFYIWQLPQHILALILIAILKARKHGPMRGKRVYFTDHKIWISLGNYIIVNKLCRKLTLLHEHGHSRQSLFLGPLYLIVVGLPSITMNILTRMDILNPRTYYKRWPESWADRLGGVIR